MRKTGRVSALSCWKKSSSSHSEAERVRAVPSEVPVLAVCFSRIWSRLFRASESKGWTRPLAMTGRRPKAPAGMAPGLSEGARQAETT